MKIKSLTLLLLLLVEFHVNAQQPSIGLGAEINFPSGNSSNVSAIGFGGYVKAELGLSNKFALTANGGLSSFLGRNLFGAKTPTLSYLPVKAGFKYYSSENFYVEGQLGAAIGLSNNTKTAFAWSPGIGTYIKTRGTANKIDIGLRYEGWVSSTLIIPTGTKYTTFDFIGLRVGYAFGL